ncbi:hypothetical protein FA13DRAFT_1817386 [Coprinellus micaceus]|uniref:F-box domain-containing protein n=1 Tax=Coprinellus micaceus TaxID=71717 RepID=A0A4Y7SUG7_COPMI|nr:hypothetical protein FA13DRAFT_1817386 [Coprinellus micaceus]
MSVSQADEVAIFTGSRAADAMDAATPFSTETGSVESSRGRITRRYDDLLVLQARVEQRARVCVPSPTIDASNDAITEAMNRCLQAPEILRLICDELPVVRREQRQTALALALSCRALLEPALDRLWYNVNTFEIFRCMLPSDVWKLETIRIKHKDRKDKDNYVYKLLRLKDLRRPIAAEDLDRYLNYYAPRIRKIHPRHMNFTLSPAAWHGLHLAVNWQSGALAPRAVEINWHLTPPKENLIPRTSSTRLGLITSCSRVLTLRPSISSFAPTVQFKQAPYEMPLNTQIS